MTFAELIPSLRPSMRTHLDSGGWTAGIRSGAGDALIVGKCSLTATAAVRDGDHAAMPMGRSARPARVVGRRIEADDVVDLPGEGAPGGLLAVAGTTGYPHGRGCGCLPVRRPPIVTVRVDLIRPPARRETPTDLQSRNVNEVPVSGAR